MLVYQNWNSFCRIPQDSVPEQSAAQTSGKRPLISAARTVTNSDPNNDQTVCELFDQIWLTGKLSYGSATLGLIIWPIMGIPINNEYKVVKEVLNKMKIRLRNYRSATTVQEPEHLFASVATRETKELSPL